MNHYWMYIITDPHCMQEVENIHFKTNKKGYKLLYF